MSVRSVATHLRVAKRLRNSLRFSVNAVVPFAAVAVLLSLATSSAHAQGSLDLSGVTTVMSSVETTAKLGGAIAVIIGIVFGVFQFMGRNIAGGFLAIGGGLFAGIVIGFAPQWVASLTGQSVSMVIAHVAQMAV